MDNSNENTGGTTHWKQLMNKTYLGAYSIPRGGELIVQIESVSMESFINSQGKKESGGVMRLVNAKPMILNVTNSKSIEALYGEYVEDWVGKYITLYASKARLGPDMVAALRIRHHTPRAAAAGKPPIAEDRLQKAISQILAGKFSVAKLEEKFALSEAQREAVQAATSPSADTDTDADVPSDTAVTDADVTRHNAQEDI